MEFVEATKENPLLYTKLSQEAIKKDSLFEESLRFWEEITNVYGFDPIFGRHTKKQKSKQEL